MVERRISTRKRIMRDFVIKELSAVDRPAQGHARMTLMKRADDIIDDVVKEYYGSTSPQVVAAEVSALSFDEVLADQQAREAACQVKDNVWARWHALRRSFETIAADEEVSPGDKVAAMQSSLNQFISSLEEQSEVIAESVTKALTAVPAIAELLKQDGDSKGDAPMTHGEKKQFDELHDTVAALTKQLEAATAKEPAKKAADLQAEIDKSAAQIAELAAKLAASDAEKVEAVAKAGMSDAEKEYMAGLDGKAKMDFMQASAAERKKVMSKAAADDPVVYKSEAAGETYHKSDDPRLVKLAKQADESERIAKAERERREVAEFTKRAADELADFSGEVGDKIEVLRAISKMDEAPRAALEGMLKIGAKAVAAAFDTIGHKHVDAQKSAGDFSKRVAEVAARDKLSKLAALEKAQQEFPQEFAAFQATGVQVN